MGINKRRSIKAINNLIKELDEIPDTLNGIEIYDNDWYHKARPITEKICDGIDVYHNIINYIVVYNRKPTVDDLKRYKVNSKSELEGLINNLNIHSNNYLKSLFNNKHIIWYAGVLISICTAYFIKHLLDWIDQINFIKDIHP